MTRLSSAILLKSNLKTGQMIAAHLKCQADLLRNPLRVQAGALGGNLMVLGKRNE